MNLNLKAALEYADADLPVVPCSGKRALLSYKEAAVDPKTIREWWRKWPNANVGIATITGLVFLDVDPRHGGKEGLRQLVDKYGKLPRTVRVLSGRGDGGDHRYFLRNGKDLKNATIAPGVQRKANGYVLAPPSIHPDSGQLYSWYRDRRPEDIDFADLPKWIAEAPAINSTGSSSQDDWEPLDIERIFDGVPGGERDETAFHYASSLRGRDVPKREALALMRFMWKQMEQPGQDEFPLDAALEKVHRAYRIYPAGGSTSGDPRPTTPLSVRSPDMAKARPTDWIWHHRIPSGYLSLLLGEEGIGKGTLIVWLIARLTRGELDGRFRGEPIHVGVIGDEDNFDNDWTPRLQAVGADFEFVHFIERSNFGFIELEADQEKIATVVREHGIRFLYLDQLLDNLGVKVDDWRRKQVSDALRPARALARSLDVAVTGALHPNKRGNTFRELLSGSSAFNQVSRSSLLLSIRPDDPSCRVLVRGKGNLCPEPSAFEFEITGYKIRHGDFTFTGPMVDAESVGHSDLTKDDLIGKDANSDSLTKIGTAKALLVEMLPNDGKQHLAKPIIDAAAEQGIPYMTVYRAAKAVGIVFGKEPASQAHSLWSWPVKVTLRRKGSEL